MTPRTTRLSVDAPGASLCSCRTNLCYSRAARSSRLSGAAPARRSWRIGRWPRNFFPDVPGRIPFGGLGSDDPLAFKVYQPDRLVLGKRMEDHLRIAVCHWHSFNWPGSDVFGVGHLRPALARRAPRPDDRGAGEARRGLRVLRQARRPVLLLPRPRHRARGRAPSPRSTANLDAIVDAAEAHMARTGVRLLWGTANLFSHPRYAAGAATNPDPEVFAYAAAQVKADARDDASPRRRELRPVGRPRGLRDAPQHRPRARGAAARPLPGARRRAQAPDRLQGHAADRAEAAGADQAPVRLRRRDGPRLPRPPRAREASTGSTSRPTTRRWPATASTTRSRHAVALGIFGSIDANRGDYQNGWDTDQFPNSVDELSLAVYEILRARRLHDRRLQLRREAPPPEHRPDGPVPRPHRRHRHARPGAARRPRTWSSAATLERLREARYAGWSGELGGRSSSGDARRSSRSPAQVARRRDRPAAGVGRAGAASRTW